MRSTRERSGSCTSRSIPDTRASKRNHGFKPCFASSIWSDLPDEKVIGLPFLEFSSLNVLPLNARNGGDSWETGDPTHAAPRSDGTRASRGKRGWHAPFPALLDLELHLMVVHVARNVKGHGIHTRRQPG